MSSITCNPLNRYTPPSTTPDVPFECHINTHPEDYDLNFCGGPIPSSFQTDLVQLVPFIPSLHARQYHKELSAHPELMKYMPYPKPMNESLDNVCNMVETLIRANPGSCLWAIFDLTRTDTNESGSSAAQGVCELPRGHPPLESMAGVLGLLNTSREHLSSEIGHVCILPKAQRTHVSTHAIALLQHYALDHPGLQTYDRDSQRFSAPSSLPPSPPPPALAAPFDQTTQGPPRGLGLRRLQWQADSYNAPSVRAAERVGFKGEGVIRMQRIVRTGSEPGRSGDGGEYKSRGSWMGAITWEDWEDGGVRSTMDTLVARR